MKNIYEKSIRHNNKYVSNPTTFYTQKNPKDIMQNINFSMLSECVV